MTFESRVNALEKDLSQTEQELNEARADLSQVREERDALHDQLPELLRRLEESSEASDNLRRRKLELEELEAASAQRIADLDRRLAEQQEQADREVALRLSLQSELEVSQRLNAELRAREEAEQAGPSSAESETVDLRARVAELESELRASTAPPAASLKGEPSTESPGPAVAETAQLQTNLTHLQWKLEQEMEERRLSDSHLAHQLQLFARLEEEKRASDQRAVQAEDLLLLTEKELFHRQRQFLEECSKVESLAQDFKQIRLLREELEDQVRHLKETNAKNEEQIADLQTELHRTSHNA